MAVAVDSRLDAGDTLSFSYTCSGSNRYLTVGVNMGDRTTTITGITYASIAMAQLNRALPVSSTFSVNLWGLVNPASGSNTVAITLSGASPGVAAGCVSFTGVHQITPTDGAALTVSTNSNPFATAAKTVVTGDMLVDVVGAFNQVGAITIAAPAISQWDDGSGDAQGTRLGDGTSQTITWTGSSGSPDNAGVMAMLLQTSSATPADAPPMEILGWGAC